MKKSSLAKFLLSTMLLPTAIAGSCKAGLEPLHLGIVSNYLDTSNQNNLRQVSKKTGADLNQSVFLLDLKDCSGSTMESKIKNYLESYSKAERIILIRGLRIEKSKFDEEILFDSRFKDKISEKVSTIIFDNISLSPTALNNLRKFREEFPNMKIIIKKIEFEIRNEITEEDLENLLEIISSNRIRNQGIGLETITFNYLSEEILQLAHALLSNPEIANSNEKINMEIIQSTISNNELSGFIKNHENKIKRVFLNRTMVSDMEPLLKDVHIEKHYLMSPFTFDYTKYVTNSQKEDFKNFFGEVRIKTLDELDLNKLQHAKPLNAMALSIRQNLTGKMIKSGENEIKNYFEERSKKIDALFKEDIFYNVGVNCPLLCDYMAKVYNIPDSMVEFINEKLIEEAIHIAQLLEPVGGKLRIYVAIDNPIVKKFPDLLNRQKNMSLETKMTF